MNKAFNFLIIDRICYSVIPCSYSLGKAHEKAYIKTYQSIMDKPENKGQDLQEAEGHILSRHMEKSAASNSELY